MIYQIKSILLLSLVLTSCVPVVNVSSSQDLDTFITDQEFSENVGFAHIMGTGLREPASFSPVVRLGNAASLILNFDLLLEDYEYTYAKILHCNADWSRSMLNDIEYLEEFNEIPINDYSFSEGNLTPYVSYRFRLPNVTKSGNFAVAIYKEDTDKLLLTRRFVVYEQKTAINPELRVSSDISMRSNSHEIEFSLQYSGIDAPNPTRNLQVTLLQNHNWNTAIRDLQPTNLKLEQNFLEYRHFNMENNFAGINEFRFFDTRMLSARGTNIAAVFRSSRGIEVSVQPDQSRNSKPYSEILIEDLNGGFYLRNIDPNETQSQSEYAWVNFTLESSKIQGDVFVAGKYNNWQLDSTNVLSYNPSTESYEGSIYLKQGFYNYMYFTQSSNKPYYYFEGSHFQTGNNYEILVYFREPGQVFDRVIGYQQFSSRN